MTVVLPCCVMCQANPDFSVIAKQIIQCQESSRRGWSWQTATIAGTLVSKVSEGSVSQIHVTGAGICWIVNTIIGLDFTARQLFLACKEDISVLWSWVTLIAMQNIFTYVTAIKLLKMALLRSVSIVWIVRIVVN